MEQSKAWHPMAAYLYALRLGRPALAWEYLRRNPDYQQDWRRHRLQRSDFQARQWGLHSLENPAIDARLAIPDWLGAHEVLLVPDLAPPPGAPRFNLWNLCGHKLIRHHGTHLTLVLDQPCQRIQFDFSPLLEQGLPYLCAVRPSLCTGEGVDALRQVLDLFRNNTPPPAGLSQSRPSNTALLDMRCLQALDGHLDGASLRAIARAVFGSDKVAGEWHADSHLRATTRRLVQRGNTLMAGGYRHLLDSGHTPQGCLKDQAKRP